MTTEKAQKKETQKQTPASSAAPSSAAPPKPLPWWRRWWSRVQAAVPIGFFDDDIAGVYRSAVKYAHERGRHHVSLDDLFLDTPADDALRGLLRFFGTTHEALVDDVATRLAREDPARDRSGSVRGYTGLMTNAVVHAIAAAAQRSAHGASFASEVLVECLVEDGASHVRGVFEERTDKRRVDVIRFLLQDDAEVAGDDAAGDAEEAAIVLINDDYTTQDFVIGVLKRHTDLTETAAAHVMLEVHHKGQGVVVEGPTDELRVLRAAMIEDARDAGHPLRVRLEPR